jgi:hypothetical protein
LTDDVLLGNWLRLPGRHHTLSHFSQFWEGARWLKGAAAIMRMIDITGDSPSLIPSEARDHEPSTDRAGRTKKWPTLPDDEWRWPPIDRVLARLTGVSGGPRQFHARCPAHNDHHPSLSVTEADDGRVLVHCFAGCEFFEIARSLDLQPSDFFPRRTARSRASRRRGRVP